MSPAVVIAVVAGISLGVTVILVLLRGSFQLGKLVNQVNTQDASIIKLNDKIDGLEIKFDVKFDTMETKIDAMEAKIDVMEIKFDGRFDAMEAKFDAKFDAVEAKFDAMETKIDVMEAKFDAKFDAVEAKFDAMETKFDARFDALTAAINEMRDDMQQTNRILVGLANHTHDADGRTVFTIPS